MRERDSGDRKQMGEAMPHRRPKLAERLARQLEDRILSEGWAVGTPIGNESSLAAEAGVSRWSFREAVRILEQDGLIQSRRGGGGGLFVAAPVADFVRNGLSHYLEYIRVDPAEVHWIWTRLEERMIANAALSISPAVRCTLLQLAEDADASNLSDGLECVDQIRSTLLAATGNPALALFSAAMSRMAMHASWNSSLSDGDYGALFPEIVTLVAAVARAMSEDDIICAVEYSRLYLACCRRLLDSSFLAEGQASHPGAMERAWALYPAIRPTKKAELVASHIRDSIIEAGWPVGWNMGTEPGLMERFGVGRSVLREAIRSLERLGVVHMGRGAASGLTVIAPDPAQVIATCRRHLRRSGTTEMDVAQVRDCLTPPVSDDARGTGKLAALILAIISSDLSNIG